MAFPISRTINPTLLLYAFVVISQFGLGLYQAQGIEPPAALTLVSLLGLLWIIGWWLRADSRKRQVSLVYDMGLFLYVAWPIIMPYYLLRTRGTKGLLVALGFMVAYLGATTAGIIIGLLARSSTIGH
jgi:hypothetical protein